MKCDPELMKRPDNGGDYCLRDGKVETLHINFHDSDYYVQVLLKQHIAELGIWLSSIPRKALCEAVKFIFRMHKEIQFIRYRNSRVPLGVSKKTNHFRIVLPDSPEEIMKRMSRHERHKLRNRINRLNEVGRITFHEYKADSDNPEAINAVNKFFEFKNVTHGRDYKLTARQYIQAYQVSNIYVIKCNSEVIAIKISCEQCPIVGGENHTYNTKYAKYYPGIIMQNHILGELIKKGKKEFYLGGAGTEGTRRYKQHFNSIEDITYTGIIYRHAYQYIIRCFVRSIKTWTKKILPAKIIRGLKALIRR